MLKAWNDLTENRLKNENSTEEILNQPLFYNTNFKNKPTTTEPIPPLPKPKTETKKNNIMADMQSLRPRNSNRRATEHITQNARNDN